MVLKKVKAREGYGRDYERFSRPLKLPSGGFVEDFWHLENINFSYRDKGLHSDALKLMGMGEVDMGQAAGTVAL